MSQISAKIIADSCSAINCKRITTFELQYPRFIHSELMTHRLFSRNAMSSRAVPIDKMIQQVQEDPAVPIHWGKNQSGMQAKEELTGCSRADVKGEWQLAAQNAGDSAAFMASEGAHKQIVNRILEPFQLMKTVLTSTEFENFFWLRKHEDAQPEIKALAELMFVAMQDSTPLKLNVGEWHVPYVEVVKVTGGMICEGDYRIEYRSRGESISPEDALAISSSCCAQVSYRLLDDSIEKARKVYQRLVESEPVHASPFEHQARPMDLDEDYKYQNPFYDWWEGITHQDSSGNFWSGNFQGWIQHRQLIPNNVKKG